MVIVHEFNPDPGAQRAAVVALARMLEIEKSGEGELLYGPKVIGQGEPEERDLRGACPTCGAQLVSRLFYVKDRGYVTEWACWQDCGYRRVL